MYVSAKAQKKVAEQNKKSSRNQFNYAGDVFRFPGLLTLYLSDQIFFFINQEDSTIPEYEEVFLKLCAVYFIFHPTIQARPDNYRITAFFLSWHLLFTIFQIMIFPCSSC